DRGLLCRFAAGLLRDSDQHVSVGAELLQLDIAEAETAERRAHLGEIGGPRFRLHLEQGSTDEVDAEIGTVKGEQQDREERQHSPAAAMKVVMFESRMVASALANPASIAVIGLRPVRTSSRMRS